MEELGAAVAELARHTGHADIYVSRGSAHNVLFDDGRIDTISSIESGGAGARAILSGNTIYANENGSGADSAVRALRNAAAAADVHLALPKASPDILLAGERPPLPSLDSSFMHDLDRSVRAACRWVRQVTFRLSSSVRNVVIVRADGTSVSEMRRYSSFSCGVVLERDGESETGSESRSLRVGIDDFWSWGTPSDPTSVAMSALERAIRSLEARPCPAGVMTVMLDGSAGGTMIHEACGHSLEADIVQKDFSVFSDMIGKRVASPEVTMIDDPTIEGMYGSYAIDDEGTPASRTVLIEDGILKSYMTDVLSAQMGDLPLTGNGRRENWSCAPVPRMSNTFVAPGRGRRDEMLASIKEGLLVKKMGGGEVDPTSGKFVFFVSEGYLIRDGRQTEAVKGATLTGSGRDALMNIIAVGDELVLDPGVCGKSGQSVPVTDGQPSLVIKDMVVGGRDV